MRHTQRGSISVGYLLYLSFSLIMLVFVTSTLLNTLADYRLSTTINHTVQEIQHNSALHYAEQVLLSRCLPQTELTMALIGTPSNDGIATYEVRYLQRAQPNSAPSGIEISVTPNDVNIIDKMTQFLSPTKLTSTSFIFHYPLNNLLHDWQELNVVTGCIK